MRKPIAATLRPQFTWLVLLLLSIGAARLLAGHYLAGVHDGRLQALDDARQANQRMLQDLTDIETAALRYQLTGDPAYLEAFRAGSADYPVARTAALRTAPDDRTRVLVRDQDQAAQRWLAQVALPISALPAGRPGADADRSARGKDLFDAIRAANVAVTTAVEDTRKTTTAAYRRTDRVLEAALALLSLLPALIAVRVYRSVRALLTAPPTTPRDPLDEPPATAPVGEPVIHDLDLPTGGGRIAGAALPDHVHRP
ncbi:CHASE3 domain-containing protein [Dactylosporangium sp. NPDC049742]|uniref:CHASE3 domain-containing protein n=1 Tax=Dactylosporangium sp. NPDC049742 TaxID=3154737 RepID=UPI0034223C98